MNLKKRSILTAASLCIMLTLSACDKSNTEESTQSSAQETSQQVTAEQKQYMPVSKVSSELSAMGAIGAVTSMTELDAEQQACLEDLDEHFAADELDAYFKENYTEDELKTLNDYFSSEIGIKAIKYSSQQMMQIFGGEAPDPADALSEEELMEVVKTSQDPAFVKYNNFSLQQGEGGLQELIKPLILEEFEKCNITETQS